MTENDLAGIIWRHCHDTGYPITVGASWQAAHAAAVLLGPGPSSPDRRPLVAWVIEELGPHDLPAGQLAARLRRVADRLEDDAHRRMKADAA